MPRKVNRRILGLTQTEFSILSAMVGLMLCAFLSMGGYVLYTSRLSYPVAAVLPTPTLTSGEAILPEPTSRYTVARIAEKDGDVWVLLVADKNYLENEAKWTIERYLSEYGDAKALIVDILCDSRYADIAYYWETPADYDEYDKYVMYE